MSHSPPPDTEQRELPRAGYVRRRFLLSYLSIHPNTLDHWIKSGRFPSPVKFGDRVVAWKAEDVRRWLRNREGAQG